MPQPTKIQIQPVLLTTFPFHDDPAPRSRGAVRVDEEPLGSVLDGSIGTPRPEPKPLSRGRGHFLFLTEFQHLAKFDGVRAR
jgi:hypothetical protein